MAKLTFKRPLPEDKQKITTKFLFYKHLVKLLISLSIIELIIITYLLVK